MKTIFLCVVSLIAVPAMADTITYTFTLDGTGTLGGSSFTNALVSFVAIANSSASTSVISATVAVGTQSYLLPPTFVSVHKGNCHASSEFPAVHSCVEMYSPIGDLLLISSNALDAYQNGEPFSTVTDPTPFAASPIFTGQNTTPLGLTLTSVSNGTFSAAVTTPETASLIQLGIGMAIIVLRRKPVA
jgi:hypothetical protein